MGADSGGERAAAICALTGTAELNGLDPEAYLRQVLACIADHPSIAMLSCCHGMSPISSTLHSKSSRPDPTLKIHVLWPDAFVRQCGGDIDRSSKWIDRDHRSATIFSDGQ